MPEFNLSVDSSKSAENTTENTEKEGVDYITFNDEKYTEFIECSDGEKVPKVENRLRSGEKYAVACLLNYKLGPEVGDSELSSKVYEFEHDSFPNRAIGQFEGMESPEDLELEKAISPGHYFYRIAGSGKIKSELKDEFHEECEKAGIPKNLEVYKRNFPVRQNSDGSEFVTVEEIDGKPWENHQIPPEWENEYEGFPPVLEEEPETESESESETEFDGEISTPESEEEWEEMSDSDKMRSVLQNNPGFEGLEKSQKVEIFTEQFGFGKSNTYNTLKGWNSETETETDSEMVEISKERLNELENAEEKLEELQNMMG